MIEGKSAVRREDLLRFRLPNFQRRLAATERAVEAALSQTARPIVAFSGGKDALCVAALVLRQAPGTICHWSDDELEYPAQPTYIPAAVAALGGRLLVTLGHAQHGGWFRPWDDRPFWRDPLPGSLVISERVETWLPKVGYDGVFLGLRAAERPSRRSHLRANGTLFCDRAGVWHSNPLAWWSVGDVWALIAGWDLPINPTYDRLATIGVDRPAQRVGPLPLSPGWMLRQGWPDLFARLVARYGTRWGA